MIDADIFVGVVTIGLGIFLASVAIFNWEWYYQLRKARWVESLCGRAGARVFHVLLGLALIVLGAAIATGFGLNRSTPRGQSQDWPPRPGRAVTIALVRFDCAGA